MCAALIDSHKYALEPKPPTRKTAYDGVSISQARRRKVAYLNLEAFRMVFLHTFDIDLLGLLTNKSIDFLEDGLEDVV